METGMRGDTKPGLGLVWCWESGGSGRWWQRTVGVRPEGRSSGQQLHWEQSGHVFSELSEIHTVSFCLLKGGWEDAVSCPCHTVSFT